MLTNIFNFLLIGGLKTDLTADTTQADEGKKGHFLEALVLQCPGMQHPSGRKNNSTAELIPPFHPQWPNGKRQGKHAIEIEEIRIDLIQMSLQIGTAHRIRRNITNLNPGLPRYPGI